MPLNIEASHDIPTKRKQKKTRQKDETDGKKLKIKEKRNQRKVERKEKVTLIDNWMTQEVEWLTMSGSVLLISRPYLPK